MNPPDRQASLLLAGYALVTGFLVLRHEPWRDELQVWGLARASDSLGALFQNLAHEGHPPLWPLLVWLVSRATADPFGMQALAWAFAVGAAAIVAYRAPFGWRVKAAILASYPLAYEWSVVARGYGLGALLAFACCALWPARRERPWAIGLAMGLMALTSVYGLIVAGAFGLALALDAWRSPAWRERMRAAPDGPVAGAALALGGAALALWSALPPADFVPGGGPPLVGDAAAAVNGLARLGWAFVPLPGNADHPWNTAGLGPVASIAFGLVFLAFVHVAGLRRRPVARAFYWAGTAALVAFSIFVFPGAMRHLMHLPLVALAALWLGRYESTDDGAVRFEAAVVCLLGPSIAAALWLGLADATRPFSGAKEMAAWIAANRVDPAAIVAAPDFSTVGVGAFLDAPIRTAQGAPPRRFVVWDRARLVPPDLEGAVARVDRKPVYLLLDHPLVAPGATLLTTTADGIVRDERLYLYRLAP